MVRAKSDRSEGRLGLSLLIIVALVMLVFGRDAAQDRRASPTLTDDIQAPVATVLSRPFRAIEEGLRSREDRRRAHEENRALRRELASMRRERDRLMAMQDRLARLETTLSIRVNGDIPSQRITARVVSDPGSPFVRSFLLSAGTEDGVEAGYAVMSDAGLVGHVLSAGQRSSRVLRLDDLNSRVAVMSVRSGARAILVGTNEGTPTLKFIANSEGWIEGDRVVTSGDDGQLPMGLPVGRVIEKAQVELGYRKQSVDWVILLPFEPMARDEDVEARMQEGLSASDEPALTPEPELAPAPAPAPVSEAG
jgi:rod shape-determining protein MreC